MIYLFLYRLFIFIPFIYFYTGIKKCFISESEEKIPGNFIDTKNVLIHPEDTFSRISRKNKRFISNWRYCKTRDKRGGGVNSVEVVTFGSLRIICVDYKKSRKAYFTFAGRRGPEAWGGVKYRGGGASWSKKRAGNLAWGASLVACLTVRIIIKAF